MVADGSMVPLRKAALSSPSVLDDDVAALYAPDQLELLRTTRRGTPLADASVAGAPRRTNTKGEPMVRFTDTTAQSVLPFASAFVLSVQRESRHRQAVLKQERQEDGHDDDPENKTIVEVEEMDVLEPLPVCGDHSEEKSTTFRVRTNEPLRCGATLLPSRHAGIGTTRVRPAESASSSQQKRQRTQSPSGLNEPTTLTYREQEFDMTEPRNYRWEIKGEKSGRPGGNLPTRTACHDSMNMARVVNMPCPLNQDLLSDSWIDAIGWNSTTDLPESKLVLDENDSLMVFSAPDTEENRPTLQVPRRKIGAAELHLEELYEQRIANIQRIEEHICGGRRISGRRHDIRHDIGQAHHLLPAIKLSLTKPELSKPMLRAFHRPRGKFTINEQLQFAPPPSSNATFDMNEMNSAMIMPIKKSSDLYPTAGGKLILLEYTEQNPPMLSNPGMAARLVHYWRPPAHNAESVGTGKKKISVATSENSPPPDTKIGHVITLGDCNASPFIGDVPAGRVVTSLNSKLFKVPIFPHKAVPPFATKSEDRNSGAYEVFLLCHPVATSKKAGLTKSAMHLMEMPQLFTAGQVEPQMEVPAPNSRIANDIILPYIAFHILRLFKKAEDGECLKIEDAACAFPSQSGTRIRKRMKEVAIFERGGSDSGCWKK